MPQLPAPATGRPRRHDSIADRGWSEAAVERLKALWKDDGLSASAIARQLGVTRNAVLGKIHRLGLSNRRPVSAHPRLPKASRTPRLLRAPTQRTGAERPVARVAAEPLDGLVERLEHLGAHVCHWPIGDPRDPLFRFCGRSARLAPYCDPHRTMAYQPGAGRLRSGRVGRSAA